MRRIEALEQIERSLGTIGRVGSSTSAARRRAAQAGVEVSVPGMGILGVLERSSPLRVSALARRAGMGPTLASRELRALEALGYVERTTDGSDARAVAVSLTAEGHDAYHRLRSASVEAAAEALAGWTAVDLTQLARLLARVADDFSGPRAPSQPPAAPAVRGSRRAGGGAGRTNGPDRAR
jgi:DNA-binding MarR family transcriptional regulator